MGTLLVLPFTGFISDRFGRKIMLVISIFNMAFFGLLKAFSVNYTMYLSLQLLQTTLGGGLFSTSYILGRLIFLKFMKLMTNILKYRIQWINWHWHLKMIIIRSSVTIFFFVICNLFKIFNDNTMKSIGSYSMFFCVRSFS